MTFEYAPAPESRDGRRHRQFATACSSTGPSRTPLAARPSRRSIRPPRRCCPRSPRRAPHDVDRAVRAARTAYETVWGPMSGRERAKYLYRIARLIQERCRELAVLETLDNGKPIRESRDVDVPLVAAHFFYHAGWADKLEYAVSGPATRAARRGRADHPLELPAAHARLEGRARTGVRQHGRAQAGRDDAAHRARLRRHLPAGRPAARCREHPHRRGRDGPAARRAPRASTRSPSRARPQVGKEIMRSLAGSTTRLTLELGGKAANIVFDDAPVDQAVEGIVNGIYFNQGHVCCAGSRLLVQESVAEEVVESLKRRLGDAAPGRPARQEHRHRRHQLRGAAGPDHRAGGQRRGRGRRSLERPLRAAGRRLRGSRRRCSPTSRRRIASRARRSSARCCRS